VAKFKSAPDAVGLPNPLMRGSLCFDENSRLVSRLCIVMAFEIINLLTY